MFGDGGSLFSARFRDYNPLQAFAAFPPRIEKLTLAESDGFLGNLNPPWLVTLPELQVVGAFPTGKFYPHSQIHAKKLVNAIRHALLGQGVLRDPPHPPLSMAHCNEDRNGHPGRGPPKNPGARNCGQFSACPRFSFR